LTAKIRKRMLPISIFVVLFVAISLMSVSSVNAAPAPQKPELYGPYYAGTYTPVNPYYLEKLVYYRWGAHTPHISGYGLHYQIWWGGAQHTDFWIPYDNDMPDTTHKWYTGGYYTVQVRACCYDRSTGADCSDWSAWTSLQIRVLPLPPYQ
jgi:hypothetical protein